MGDRTVKAYVAVGSNIDPEEHILKALKELARHVRVAATSTFYRTAALDRPEQPPFLNGVWRIETAAEPRALKFDVLRGIEGSLGRVRTGDRYAARPIDLDLELYGDMVIDEPGLRLPDPEIRVRPFIALPILECDPDIVLPDTGERLDSIFGLEDRRRLVRAVEFTERVAESVREQLKQRSTPWTRNA